MAIFFLIVQLGFLFLIIFMTLAFLTGAPYVPSSPKAASAMIRLAKCRRGMTVYDLGSGDGKLLILAAATGARAVGIEINPYLLVYSLIRAWLSPYRRQIRVIWRSFWSCRLTDADIVFLYLVPWRMERLEKHLIKKLKPGTVIVSNSFMFPTIPKIAADAENHIYAYRIPDSS
ncbi:hypothetical protein A2Z33_01025 [Candidatus Gottesmanbacteria bacterium RBG_16_52_11]|uniref:DOT1 domain-containing protein n=1 Tax=Candidatus Gottesmanbacteria bacterium RBG_16_52_11 TaxID=1798374 RepID=A0A1F5YNP3_9BACT|nr:MAG: hypothetical protein A2Z33_01025 [Candidatus Gottesmanbacteria bacterium RBG_16_52_11]